MKFENTEVYGFKRALKGMRNPLESWRKNDTVEENGKVVIGENDLDLAQRLIKSGSEHRKFMRQIFVSVDITGPLYWWKEFDTYKVGTTANSTSTMHKLASTPITAECFEIDDYNSDLDYDGTKLGDVIDKHIEFLESMRVKYLETKDKAYWKELIRWLPSAWQQTRTVTMTYENLLAMCSKGQRRFHKLTEWSKSFIDWARTLPYAQEYTRITAIGFPFLIANTGMSKLILADGSPRYSMTSMLVGAIVNTILDPIFIFGLHMGMRGAALATIIGQIVSFCISLRYMFHFKTIRLTKESFHMTGKHIENIFKFGASACFNQIAMTIVQIVLNNTLSHYGAQSVYGGDIPLACAGIITKVNMIFMSFVIGISQGIQPIISYNYGAGNYERVKQTYKKAVTAALGISMVAFLLFQLAPRQIIGIFGSGSEEYFLFAEKFFRIYMFFTFINGIHPITANTFTSIGKAGKGVFLSLTRQIIFLLPLLIILPVFVGIEGVMFSAPVADGIAALLCIFFITKEFKHMGTVAGTV